MGRTAKCDRVADRESVRGEALTVETGTIIVATSRRSAIAKIVLCRTLAYLRSEAIEDSWSNVEGQDLTPDGGGQLPKSGKPLRIGGLPTSHGSAQTLASAPPGGWDIGLGAARRVGADRSGPTNGSSGRTVFLGPSEVYPLGLVGPLLSVAVSGRQSVPTIPRSRSGCSPATGFWVLVGPHPNLVALRAVRSHPPRDHHHGKRDTAREHLRSLQPNSISVEFGGWRPPNPPKMVFVSAHTAHSAL
jgi:hypothetical protein